MAWTSPYTSTVGMVLTAALKNQDRDNFNYLKGSTTSYTPQVDQGATTNISKTVTEARYTQRGDVCDVWLDLSMTGVGTASNAVTITLPVTASGHSSAAHIGPALYYRSAGPYRFQGNFELTTTTKVVISGSAGTSGTIGGTFVASPATTAFAVASGDIIRGAMSYVVA